MAPGQPGGAAMPPWTQQPRMSQQETSPRSLSKGLRRGQLTGSEQGQATHCCPQWPKGEAESVIFRRQKEQSSLSRNSSCPPHHPHCSSMKTSDSRERLGIPHADQQSGGGASAPPPSPFLGGSNHQGLDEHGLLPWAMRVSPWAWPLCRCHSESCGRSGS